jgi:hypothetical protein
MQRLEEHHKELEERRSRNDDFLREFEETQKNNDEMLREMREFDRTTGYSIWYDAYRRLLIG